MLEIERKQAVARLVTETKDILDVRPLSRETLAHILAKLERLAACREFWSESVFPSPSFEERQVLYLLSEEADHTFALYLSAMRRKHIPPHNHMTWACIAAIEGAEINYIYERLDRGETPSQCQIRLAATTSVEPGRGLAFMPEDIHAIENDADGAIRHLHFYGRALEVLDERLVFDPGTGTCRPMVMDVVSRR